MEKGFLIYLSVLGGFSIVFLAWAIVCLKRQKKKGQHSIFISEENLEN